MAAEIRSDGPDGRGGELTGVARVPAISGSGLHVGCDAVLLGTREGDYEVQRGAASS
jgi:hypothetical protein